MIKKMMNENKTWVQQSRAEDKFLKSNVRKPKSKVLHLALLARVGQGRPSLQGPDTMRKSSFIPLLDLGRHEISLTALDRDLR